jgi:hypothetical protein
MADYHQLKNAAILTPTTNTDLGSTTNPYSNVYLSGNIAMSNGIVINPTTVTSPKISSITYPGAITAVLPAGGETVTITGTGFSNTGGTPQVFIGTTVVPTVTYVSSTSLTFTTPALSVNVYSLYVVNSDGGVGIYAPGISFSGTPTWTTAAGSIGSTQQNSSSSFTVLATSDSVVTYSVKAGSSLPSGLSLNSSTGAITGTAPTPANQTTYTFTLTATDTENQTTDRTFSITVLTSLIVDYIVVAGGGSGGGTYYGGGGGAGGLLVSSITLTPSTTYTVVVGAGASPGAANGSNSSLNGTGLSVTTIGGGRGGATYGGEPGTSGGSGGGSAAAGAYNNGAGTAGPPRQGYSGGTVSSGNAIYGGGGGGSGGAGQSGATAASPSGTGGLGTNLASIVGTSLATSSSIGFVSGSEVQFAGGGGGGIDANQGNPAWTAPGSAGGGIGAKYVTGQNAGAGQANTGSGGGGGCHPGTSNGIGGAGGSGVVVIRYPGATAQATGGTIIDTSGGYVTHIFKTTGTFSFVTGA